MGTPIYVYFRNQDPKYENKYGYCPMLRVEKHELTAYILGNLDSPAGIDLMYQGEVYSKHNRPGWELLEYLDAVEAEHRPDVYAR